MGEMGSTNDGGRHRPPIRVGRPGVAMAIIVAAMVTGSVGVVAAESHERVDVGRPPAGPPVAIDETETGTAGDDPVTETYIWCVIDAGSLGVPNPIEACRGIG